MIFLIVLLMLEGVDVRFELWGTKGLEIRMFGNGH